ncbi:MAG: HK97 family phage prohead protease [Erythrobacter sp.]|nr:HK97 family phage prohead protease [Erythrobacter sp.]
MTGASPPPLRFAGYAALFDIADAARDTIQPGAFAQTLHGRRGPVPLFWQHRPDTAIGMIETIAEDSRGLRVIGRIDNPLGRAAQMLRRGEVSGLSFGYRASGYQQGQRGRILTEIELFEVSLVTHPLQHGARVHFVT